MGDGGGTSLTDSAVELGVLLAGGSGNSLGGRQRQTGGCWEPSCGGPRGSVKESVAPAGASQVSPAGAFQEVRLRARAGSRTGHGG